MSRKSRPAANPSPLPDNARPGDPNRRPRPRLPMTSSEPVERTAAATAALLFLTVAGVYGQAPAGHWCATTIDLPEGPPRSAIDYQMVEAPAASETVVIGVLFLYTDGLTESQVRRRSVEWIKTANQYLNNGTAGYRIVLKRAGVRAAPGSVSQAAAQPRDAETYSSEYKQAVLSAVGNAHRDLHSVRRELGADLVTVVVPGNVGGIANLWYRDTPAAAFVRFSYNVISMERDGFVLAHEVGHNLGLVHDRPAERAAGNDPAEISGWLHDRHGFGYVTHSFANGASAPDGIGTVMAALGGWNLMPGFSRPAGYLNVVGRRSKAKRGDSTTNADRALRATAHLAAAFYEAAPNDPDPPPEPKPDPPKPDPPPKDPGPPPTGREPCISTDGTMYCHVTEFGPLFAVQFFHEGEWSFAEIAVSSGDSTVFHFFGPDNLEVFAKVLNGCAIDGSVWVYASGLTDLPIVLHVWPEGGGGQSEPFQIPDGTVLRPQNGGRLNWC